MGWENVALSTVGSAVLLTGCFLLGAFNFSFIWIAGFVLLSGLKSHLWRLREKRLIGLRETATREREVIEQQLKAELPAWVSFPDVERVEWINKVILQLWPYVGEYTRTFMREFIEPQVRAQLPAAFRSFKFVKMDIGDIPCRVGGIKVYTVNVGRDRIIVDMDVAYAGDADFTVQCSGFTGGMNQLVFSGKLRAILKPLLPYPPMVGGVSASFLEQPKLDFNLTGLGEMIELPGLMNAVRSVVNSQMAAICVLPNEVVIPLAPHVDVTRLYFPEPDGVIRLKVIEARNLENRDISLFKKGKSDPYCEIQVGSQFFKTKTIDNDLNPVWNEYFEAVVDQADGQKLRIELFDKDSPGSDEELGRLSLDLDRIRKKGLIDKWFPLEGCKLVEVTLGKETQKTPVKPKTVNPLFQSKHLFFVRNAEAQELKFKAVDEGTRRSLGELALPVRLLMSEPNMELAQQTLQLSLGVHQSPIVITVRLRSLKNVESVESTAPTEQLNAAIGKTEKLNATIGKTVQLAPTNPTMTNGMQQQNGSMIVRSKPSDDNLIRVPSSDSGRGRLLVVIRYDDQMGRLIVRVTRASDLRPVQNNKADPFVVVKLQTLGGKSIFKRKSGVVLNSAEPVFDNEFDFDIRRSDMLNHALLLSVRDASITGFFAKKKNNLLGQVHIPLSAPETLTDYAGKWILLDSIKK